MKRILCFWLAALLALSMCGCDSFAEYVKELNAQKNPDLGDEPYFSIATRDPSDTQPDDATTDTQEETTQPTKPKPTEDTTPKTWGTVTAQDLRIRELPNTACEILGLLNLGERVEIGRTTEINGSTWGKISNGWICLDYVLLDGEEPDDDKEPSTDPGAGLGATVQGDGLRVRAEANTNAQSNDTLNSGDRVRIQKLQATDGVLWGYVGSGWISLEYVKLDMCTEDAILAATITANGLNIRAEANTTSNVEGTLKSDERVLVQEFKAVGSAVWGKISNGWISLNYVQLDDGVGVVKGKT